MSNWGYDIPSSGVSAASPQSIPRPTTTRLWTAIQEISNLTFVTGQTVANSVITPKAEKCASTCMEKPICSSTLPVTCHPDLFQ